MIRERDGVTRVLGRTLLVLFALGVLVASTVPPPAGSLAGSGPLGLPVDAWYHIFAYAGLGIGAAAVQSSDLGPVRRALVAVVVAAGFGAGIEVVQLALPARAFSASDLLANGVGATVGVAGWLALRWIGSRRS